ASSRRPIRVPGAGAGPAHVSDAERDERHGASSMASAPSKFAAPFLVGSRLGRTLRTRRESSRYPFATLPDSSVTRKAELERESSRLLSKLFGRCGSDLSQVAFGTSSREPSPLPPLMSEQWGEVRAGCRAAVS